jgi:hypothetical protein
VLGGVEPPRAPSGQAAAPPMSVMNSRRFVCRESRPIALAVLRLITNSNFVDCWTGSSAGFSPLRMRPA